jgi:hypothetical protein
MKKSIRRARVVRVAMVGALAGALVVAWAAQAGAHVEADPARVKPGKSVAVEFVNEHGCGNTPTTSMEFKVPKGVTDAQPAEKDGFTATAEDGTILFEGESADAEEDSFAILFTAPSKKGLLIWKVVQRCDQKVIRWIDTEDGAKYPPPVVGVGKNPPEEH